MVTIFASARLVVVAFLVGMGVRLSTAHLVTGDAEIFLIPWFEFAKAQGASALSRDFTNYTPFYTYCLLAVSWIPASPILLIKSISWFFELGAAVLGYRLAGERGRYAFAALWMAPTALFNGPVWGQADSLWGFFCLLSIYLFAQQRNGSVPFGVAFAIKAQAVFLSPFVLGMLLRSRKALWLVSVPIVYAALALPVVAAGRPLSSVLGVYFDQAIQFHELSRSAANFWTLFPIDYEWGIVIGSALAFAIGLALAVFCARLNDARPQFVVKLACLSLLLMPFVLPKMHERYFYGFEITAIVLACMNPRMWWLALGGQISGVLAYLTFAFPNQTVWPAAVLNLLLSIGLVVSTVRHSGLAKSDA